jgi:hypothetical protein
MEFGFKVLIVFAVVLVLDTLWLVVNTKWSGGLYYSLMDNFETRIIWTLPCSVGCWIMSALYISAHEYDTPWHGLREGLWLGSLVYGVYNFTTCIVFPPWKEGGDNIWQKLRPVIDTLWGVVLFGAAASVSALADCD